MASIQLRESCIHLSARAMATGIWAKSSKLNHQWTSHKIHCYHNSSSHQVACTIIAPACIMWHVWLKDNRNLSSQQVVYPPTKIVIDYTHALSSEVSGVGSESEEDLSRHSNWAKAVAMVKCICNCWAVAISIYWFSLTSYSASHFEYNTKFGL